MTKKEIEAFDSLGNKLSIGQECVFSRNLWRGKDVLCKGRIVSLAKSMAVVDVIGTQPVGINLYEGWNIQKRAKLSKLLGLNSQSPVESVIETLKNNEINKMTVTNVEDNKYEIWADDGVYVGRYSK